MKVLLKGTVSIILIDPTSKDGNVRLTTVPLKAISLVKYELDISDFVSLNCLFSFVGSL